MNIRSSRAGAPAAVILIRLAVGGVFLLEGIKKFLFPADWGVGRFIKIGIPVPTILAPFVGAVEVVCGALLLIGLLTQLAAVPLLIDIAVAILTTKVPLLLQRGFWPMEADARTDYAMFMGLLFLLIAGGGAWSIDARRPASSGGSRGSA
jgi:putative oxidoreductase